MVGLDDVSDGRELFCLGLLHDVGYEFADNALDHPRARAEVLASLGLPFAAEVAGHGDPSVSRRSLCLDVLDAADMTTGPSGEAMTFAERLDDIADRHGSDSSEFSRSCEVCRILSERLLEGIGWVVGEDGPELVLEESRGPSM